MLHDEKQTGAIFTTLNGASLPLMFMEAARVATNHRGSSEE